MTRTLSAIALLAIGVVGCIGSVGKPTDQEVQQMNAWAAVVTPQDRATVQREAEMHTDWLPRRKVQWMTGQYKSKYEHYQSKASTRASTTTPTTTPTDAFSPGGL